MTTREIGPAEAIVDPASDGPRLHPNYHRNMNRATAVREDLAARAATPVSEEYQYLDLVRHIIKHGVQRIDRTLVGTRAVFGPQTLSDCSAAAANPVSGPVRHPE